jgi:glyoxylase-like metal-dependent hydrolase (beta-lactamase superfamily II)
MKTMGRFTVLRQGGVAIHSYACPDDSEAVNSHVVETLHALVLIDAQQFIPYATELREYMDRLGKPVERIIVTHSHPDHWMGLICFEDLPIYAIEETKQEIEATGDYLIAYKKGQVEDISRYHKVVPPFTLKEGEVVIDGITFRLSKVTDAEMAFMLTVELPEFKTLIAQDLVYNGVYACVGEKNATGEYLFDGWIEALKGLKNKDYATILPGHGDVAGPEVLDEMIKYLRFAKKTFESGVDDKGFKAAMKRRYPRYRVDELLDISNLFLYHHTW